MSGRSLVARRRADVGDAWIRERRAHSPFACCCLTRTHVPPTNSPPSRGPFPSFPLLQVFDDKKQFASWFGEQLDKAVGRERVIVFIELQQLHAATTRPPKNTIPYKNTHPDPPPPTTPQGDDDGYDAGGGLSESDMLAREKKLVVVHRLHQILLPFMLRRQVRGRAGGGRGRR